MLRTIRLHGELGKRFGRVHKLDVTTPGEAIRALTANYPEMADFLMESESKGLAYKCMVDGERIGEDQLPNPMSKSFSITPVVRGRGKVGAIILGVALIGAAILMPAFTPVFSAFGTTFGFSASATFALGAAITLGGIAMLLAPTPTNSKAEKQDNPYFDGPAQTTAQGSSVPFGYGRMIIGSRVISAAITVSDQYTGGSPYIGGFAGQNGMRLNA